MKALPMAGRCRGPSSRPKHLTELDVQVLIHLYDWIDFQQGLRYLGDHRWDRDPPSLTVFEPAYELARLQTSGMGASICH